MRVGVLCACVGEHVCVCGGNDNIMVHYIMIFKLVQYI